ncbi:MAG: anti-sigma factor [Acidimicrobiales bacterium]
MTDHFPDSDNTEDPFAAFDDPELLRLLADENTWSDTDPNDEAMILAAIGDLLASDDGPRTTEASISSEPVSASPSPSTSEPSERTEPRLAPVVELSRFRRLALPALAGAAAASVVFAALTLRPSSDPSPDAELALAPTDLVPGAAGNIDVFDTANGTRIVLDVSGLPPAEPGQYYEAWLRQDPEVGVSAGTFHLRGGGGTIELWAGVTIDDYPLFTITVQDEADTTSSGKVVLMVRLDD